MDYIMDLRKELGHRPLIMAGACVLFINEKNEILLQERADNHYWGYPGGSMELGESFEECAKREAFEESGLIADELLYFDTKSGKSTHYIYPNGDEIYVAVVVFLCRKYHGEMKVQEEEVIQQRFFSEDELPERMDPMNEDFIRRAFAMLKTGTARSSEVEELIDFRLLANRNTYAAYSNEVEASRPSAHDFKYEKDGYTYIDTYVGGEQFAGEEAVFRDGIAKYAMNYCGRVLDGAFSGDFLKEALRAATRELPYRGPEHYSSGEYTYTCKVTGDIDWFQGYEEIFHAGTKVYECFFHGGLMH